MKQLSLQLKRFGYSLAASVVMLASTVGILASPLASATTAQVSVRSIQLSSSAASATAVNYLVGFTPTTTGAQSLVVNFCSNSAVIGDSCTTPAGFTAASATLTAGTGTANWAIGALTANTFKMTKSTGSAFTTVPITFTIANVTNPNSTGSFYARVYTYVDAAYGAGTPYTSPTVIGNNLDYGGFAMSIANVVTVTATIMETLTFCVSKAAPGAGCTGQTSPALTLGHGGPPVTLDATAVDTDTAYTQLGTNAVSGAIVNMKTNNTCSGLSRDGGATCAITGKGAFGTVSAGTAFFGLNVANGTGGTGAVNANVNYGTTSGSYGMGTNVTAAYGDTIEASTAACANMNSLLTFGATAATTTPAGVYSASENLIATGTF